MKCLDQYIFTEFIKKFFLFFIITTALLLFEDIYANLRTFLAYHATYWEVFRYYILHCILLIPLTLPITFTLSLLFSVYYMYKNDEIIALFSSGINFFKITRIFWILAFILSILLLMSNFWIFPKIHGYIRTCSEQILSHNKGSKKFFELRHLSLNNKKRLWYINCYNKMTHQAYDLAVHEYDFNGNEYRRIFAQYGQFDEKTQTWKMQNGREIFLDPDRHIVKAVDIFSERVFKDLDESSELMINMQIPSKKLSMMQLRQIIQYEVEGKIFENPTYKLRFWSIIFYSFTCCFLIAYLLPLFFLKLHENFIKNVTKIIIFIVLFLIISHIHYALGENGTIHWALAIFAPFIYFCFIPLLWIRKLF